MKNVEDLYPLSPMQQGILFHSLYSTESDMYVLQVGWSHSEDVCLPAFEQAWQQVLARHAILRTAFVWEDLDEPLQVVYNKLPLTINHYDWQDLASTAQQELFESFLKEDRDRGFDLLDAPLMRLHLIKLGQERFHFVWTFHHLLLDGWSMFLVLKEVFDIYEAARRDNGLFLKKTRPYKDYIAWLQQQSKAEAEAVWRKALEGFTTPTYLNESANNNGHAAADGDKVRYRVSPTSELTAKLDYFAKANRLTLGTVIQGAWALLLSRYSRQQDVVFGVTVSGRPPMIPGIEEMVGMFINTLPLRVQLRPNATVLSWLNENQENQINLQQYLYTPLVEIQKWSDIPAGRPLFESILIHENYPVDSALRELAHGSKISDIHFRLALDYPLALVVIREPEPAWEFVYNPQHFDPALIKRMAGHLIKLIKGMVAGFHQKIDAISMLTAAERRQILDEWNDTARDYAKQSCIQAIFEEQVEITPDALALMFEDQQLSYRELNNRSNRLAHYLRSLGVGPDIPVGIYLDRSLEMATSILAILKAGGVYLPLDTAYPAQRLTYMVEDSGAEIILTQRDLLSNLDNIKGKLISLNDHWAEISSYSSDNPVNTASAENLAYIIYTSGSTGKPKGVCLQHSALANLFQWHKDELLNGVRTLQFASIGFDVSPHEMFAGWMTGGVVLIASQQQRTDVTELGRYIVEQRVEKMILPVVVLQQIAEMYSDRPQALEAVKEILTTGEQLQITRAVKELFGQMSWAQLHNHYGPAETHAATIQRIGGEAALWEYQPPIGRPISNTQVYIIDQMHQLVPVEVTGELYISGAGVGRGYLNKAEETAEKFIPNPYSAEPGSRVYKTGDLARYRPTGEIEFLGRADHQVKVRGYRIELAEIESALNEHEMVSESVVIIKQTERGDKQIICYVVPQREDKEIGSELRRYLRERLPEYMIPAAYVVIERIPLTVNGKVDRRALPEPQYNRDEQETGAGRGRKTAVEEIVGGIWSEVLGVEEVSVEDNFFELGGHSLLAGRVIAKVRAVLGVEVVPRDIFETQTLRDFSSRLQEMSKGRGAGSVEIKRADRSKPVPLSFAQQRLWFIEQFDRGNSIYNIPILLRLKGDLDVAALEKTFTEIIRRHEVLRTVFRMEAGQAVQVIKPAQRFILEVEDVSGREEESREAEAIRIGEEEGRKGFDLEEGPLMRVKLIRVGEQEHVIAMTMHHIISDGWSIGVMVKEVGELYESYRKGEERGLEELEIQYGDYAIWQREWLQGEELDKQVGYWRKQLEGAPTVLDLPSDRPRAAEQSYRGSSEPMRIDGQLAAELKRLSRAEGVTLYMTLLSGFFTLLYRYTRQTEILVGTPIAGRSLEQTERLIGFFVNTLVMRGDMTGNPTFREFLRRVSEMSLGAYAHQDLPFDLLVEELHPERSLSYSPLIQVMFSLNQAGSGAVEIAGLELDNMSTPVETSKFDLMLLMVESKDVIEGSLTYSTDLFEASTISRMISHLTRLLTSVVSNPDARLDELEMLSYEESALLEETIEIEDLNESFLF